MMRLDLNLVEVFCCVYEEGNISKASRPCNEPEGEENQ